MTADAARRMSRLQDGIDHKQDEFGDIAPELEAEAADEDVLDALAFAWQTIEQTQVDVLEAVGIRAWRTDWQSPKPTEAGNRRGAAEPNLHSKEAVRVTACITRLRQPVHYFTRGG
jgi:hypothetical protein